jgi:O-antigen/teichoic acid export membrane protein
MVLLQGVLRAFTVTSVCSACGFVCAVLVQNKLPMEEAGRYVLLLTIIQVFTVLALLGHEKLFRRYFANFDVEEYAWRKQIKFTLLRSIPLLLAGLLWCRYQYSLNLFELCLAGIAVVSFMLSLLVGSILQSKEKFGLSAWAVGGHRVFMFLVLIPVLAIMDLRSLPVCEIAILVGFVLTTITSVCWCVSNTREGSKTIPRAYRRESLYFLGTAVSLLVYNFTDRMIIPAVMGEADLARYFAVYSPFLVFDMAAMALGSVLIVKVARNNVPVSAYTLRLAALAAAGFVACLLCFGPLVHLLYGGRYDDCRYLIPLIGLAKALNILLVVPISMLGGRLGRKALGVFAKTNVLLAPVNVLLVWWLAITMSLTGVAIGMLIISLQWNVAGFSAVICYSRTRVCADARAADPGRN